MAKEPTVITVAGVEKDTYGNLSVTDTLGNTVRINKKHESLHPLFENNQGRAIKLIWDNYKGKDFVDGAELFDGKPPLEKQVEPLSTSSEPLPDPPQSTTKPVTQLSGQEVGMWWKELGEMLRARDIKLDTPQGRQLRNSYYAQMLKVLGINLSDKGEF